MKVGIATYLHCRWQCLLELRNMHNWVYFAACW
jgi:hypothetical protein